METPKGVTVDCPVCTDPTDVNIPDGTPLGAVVRVRCPKGHAFRIRVGQTKFDVLTDEPTM